MPGSPKFEPHFAEWGKDECGVQLLWAELRAGCCMRLHAAACFNTSRLRCMEEFVAGGLAVEARLDMAIRTCVSLCL